MLTLFSSQITDLPPGRIPVQTYAIEGSDKGFEDAYKVTILYLYYFYLHCHWGSGMLHLGNAPFSPFRV